VKQNDSPSVSGEASALRYSFRAAVALLMARGDRDALRLLAIRESYYRLGIIDYGPTRTLRRYMQCRLGAEIS
jgi:hypothetical protein